MRGFYIFGGLLIGMWLLYETGHAQAVSGEIQNRCITLDPEKDYDFKLLYAVEIYADSNESQFLVPTIENLLIRLNIPNSGGKLRFNQGVDNINRLREEKDIYQYIFRTWESYSSTRLEWVSSPLRDTFEQEVVNRIKSYDDFLYIKINPQQSGYIEYQFYRYLIDKDSSFQAEIKVGNRSSRSKYVDLPVHHYLRSSSIFLNPADAPQRQISSLQKALKQVFCETNVRPTGQIIAPHPKVRDTVYFSTRDSISLTAQVFDSDSRDELFTYGWRQIEPDSSLPPLNLKNDLAHQKFLVQVSGCYQIGLRVGDGIVSAEVEDTITICVTHVPEISALKVPGNSWNTSISFKKTLSGRGRFLRKYSEPVWGLISYTDPTAVRIKIKHAPYTPTSIQNKVKLISQRIQPPYEKTRTSFENRYAFAYNIGAFYDIAPISYRDKPIRARKYIEPRKSVTDSTFFLNTFTPQQFSLPSGTYTFQLQAEENGLVSEPILLETRVWTYSMISTETALGILFQNDTTNAAYFLIGGKLELFPGYYLRAGITINSPRDTLLFNTGLLVGVDMDILGLFRKGSRIRSLYAENEELGLSVFYLFGDNAKTSLYQNLYTGTYGKLNLSGGTRQISIRAGFKTENFSQNRDLVRDHFLVELGLHVYLGRTNFAKKYR